MDREDFAAAGELRVVAPAASGWLQSAGWIALAVLAGTVAYLPFLHLPLISDDYTQIFQARAYGAVEKWPALAGDVLYRSRATSLVLTYWVDLGWGADPVAHRLASILLHALNIVLVALLGVWKRVGWRVSLPAAFAFAVISVYQEAVVWNAASPELLVLTFGLLAFLTWTSWLDRGGAARLAAACVCFLLALISKESAVVFLPAMALAGWFSPRRREQAGWIVALGCAAAVYTALIFAAAPGHLHLNDGTFSLRAPFAKTLIRSLARLLWPAGLLAVVGAALWGGSPLRWRAAWAMAWSALALGPYVFLTYMERVPSRHTYLAAVGLAFLLTFGAQAVCSRYFRVSGRLACGLAGLFVALNYGDLWLRKLPQFERRAAATERFVSFAREFAAEQPRRIAIQCSPFPPVVFEHAAVVRLGWPEGRVITGYASDAELPEGVYCDTDRP